MDSRRGWWYLISILSVPMLFLARAGLFGPGARDQSEAALQDWAAYGRAIVLALAVVILAAVLILLYT